MNNCFEEKLTNTLNCILNEIRDLNENIKLLEESLGYIDGKVDSIDIFAGKIYNYINQEDNS